MKLRPADHDDAEALAGVHAQAFDAPWTAPDIARLMTAMGGFGLLVEDAEGVAGFLVARAIGGEAEILTLAVAPRARRRGIGLGLVEAAALEAARRGGGALYLEVAADNDAATALYRATGFEQAGVRRGYYARADGGRAMDALVLRRTLNSPAA